MKTRKLFTLAALLAIFGIIGGFVACDTEPEPEPEPEVLTGDVTIDGTMRVGQTATINIANSNGTGAAAYKWTRTPDGGATLTITGASGKTYVITPDDIDHTLGAIVSFENQTGTITGTNTNKVVANEPANKGPFVTDELFNYSDISFTANIKDERVNGGIQNLQEMGIVTQIEDAITTGYNTGSGLSAAQNRSRFQNVFGGNDLTIIVNNPAVGYDGALTPDSKTMTFHIDYLQDNPADLYQAIIDAVTYMNDLSNFAM